ncbi:hypothetical protein SAMN03080615_00275 [Amphritea atlantica]|uniref:Uncharacterized protein n=1 Tax=Amphritea atlantica TaxID=355243 RepID=A0A1H9D2J8_9GAMM|nr:hypothetical protein [Amphritea atlantica]SEQ07053.1 hypothetical protein SAMN03080615_00275 [Amphritea atlantica]
MKLIILMVALLIVGLLTIQQMAPKAVAPDASADLNSTHTAPDVPEVPTRPDEVKQFGKEMSDYIQSEAAKRAAALEEAQKQ